MIYFRTKEVIALRPLEKGNKTLTLNLAGNTE